MPCLFEPIALRRLTLPHRIGIPPMCQYSAVDGMPNDWHFVHYGSRAVGGAALLIIEATAVCPEGRISPADLGLWNDFQTAAFAKARSQIESHGCVAAVQLAHAGRKASVSLGWEAQRTLAADEGGWNTVAPSAIPFGDDYVTPLELDEAGIENVVDHFTVAAKRALEAGFRTLEIHSAHGYLLHQFLSPLSNQRTDAYGGSFENRTRLTRRVAESVRAVWPEDLPIIVRLSATDWVEGGWSVDETVALCRELKKLGVDLIDVSSGGLVPWAKIPFAPGFQVPFASRVRNEAGIPTAAVGLITDPIQADELVKTGQADIVLVGREILRNPYWPLQAAHALGAEVFWPRQYLRAAPSR